MSTPSAWVLQAIEKMTSFEIYQLARHLDRMLDDPRRVVESRKHVHYGKRVRFLNGSDSTPLVGVVVGMSEDRVNIEVQSDRFPKRVPYAAVQPDGVDFSPPPAPPQPPPPPEPPARKPGEYYVGQNVSFEIAPGQPAVGVIESIKKGRATVVLESGEQWRVGFALLRPYLSV